MYELSLSIVYYGAPHPALCAKMCRCYKGYAGVMLQGLCYRGYATKVVHGLCLWQTVLAYTTEAAFIHTCKQQSTHQDVHEADDSHSTLYT